MVNSIYKFKGMYEHAREYSKDMESSVKCGLEGEYRFNLELMVCMKADNICSRHCVRTI